MSPFAPFTTDPSQSVVALGERRLIGLIREWLGAATAPAPRGIGDDCAVLPIAPTLISALSLTPPDTLIPTHRLTTTDSVIYGRHFDATVSPHSAGVKLVNRNLSDIAAMGGIPADAMLSLVCGRDLAVSWLEAFYRGVAEACLRHKTELAGGDCAEGPPGFFCATLALTGFANIPLLRTGAREGDTLLVTGDLGGSLAGKHYTFTPRLSEGRWLAVRPEIRAGMDITDGLAKDLPALLPPGCDALLDSAHLPISDAARRLSTANADSLSPLVHALSDGEDYELLVAADTSMLAELLASWRREFPALPLTPIGRIVRAAVGHGGHLLDSTDRHLLIEAGHGYAHFA
jgi:thiamine-monophosphate kinase